MNFRMLGTRVLLKPIYEEEIKNGILMPDTLEKKPIKFEVVSIGDLVDEVEIGDNVLIGQYIGIEIEKDKEIYRIVEEEEILAKIQEE